MNNKVKQAIDTMEQGYILDPNRILADYQKEKAEISGYHGRELLELLQNAVDELGGTNNRFISISLKDEVLTISNNGNVFSYEGFISLMYSNLSPKLNNTEYIGNKGTGFRSILNWSKYVDIYSGDLSVEFSETQASKTLTKLIKNKSIANFCKTHANVKLATLVAPALLPALQNKEYDTVIEISLKPNMIEKVIGQLCKINSKTLLFLEKLEKLTISYNNNIFIYKKITMPRNNDIKDTQIITSKNGVMDEIENWSILSHKEKFENQKYGVMIAYKSDMSVEPDVLYSYFKTKVNFPVHAIVHATFDLSADRNNLAETEANKQILKVICEMLVKVALLITSESVNYDSLTLLSKISDFPLGLSWDNFTFEKHYLNTIAASAVFPTVNGKYISFKESPKFYDSNIAEFLKGVAFSSLMPTTNNIAIISMIKSIAEQKKSDIHYQYSKIISGINDLLPSLKIKDRAGLWLAFINESKRDNNVVTMPNFALTSNGEAVGNGQLVFLPAENVEFSTPPAFTKIVIMNKELVFELQKIQGKKGSRELVNELSKFNVREYNIANIINAVISSLRKLGHQTSNNTLGCYEDTINWLWELWKSNILKKGIQNLNSIPLINRKGIPKNATELYFGKEFGEDITENLFNLTDDLFVCLPNKINFTKLPKPQYIEFLSNLGVAHFPRRVESTIHTMPNEYKELIYSIIKYPLIAKSYTSDNTYLNEKELRIATMRYVKVTSIEHLNEILEKASTKSIITWIMKDENLRQLLTTYEPSTSCAYVYNANQQNLREISGEQLASYLRFIFATSKWIEVDGERYAPKQCLFVSKIETKFSPLVVAPNLNLFVNNIYHKKTDTNTAQNILEQIGAASNYSDLDTNTFYSLLLNIPEVDKYGEISKALYTSILKSNGLEKLDNKNVKRKEFLKNGKVFCKSSRSFKTISEVHYLTEKTISHEILKDFNLIAIPNRQNQENIKKYFGVSTLKLKGSVVGEPTIHANNIEFEQDFKNYICYAFCSRLDIAKQSEISKVKSLRVCLCTHIVADYGKGEIILTENAYISEKNCIYIQAPHSGGILKQLKSNVDFCSSIAELFMTAIDIQDDTLYNFVRSLYEKENHNRNALILHDFDDLSILEKSRDILNRTQSEKEMFRTVCILIAGESITESINSKINSINFSNFNDSENAPTIIDILSALNVDADEFNEKSEVPVHLIPFYLKKLQELKSQRLMQYKNNLFISLKTELPNKQRLFLKDLDKYKNFLFIPSNSIAYDWKSEFISHFGNFSTLPVSESADEAWKINRSSFAQNKDLKILNEMFINKELDSLLYFGHFAELEKEYALKILSIEKTKAKESAILNSPQSSTLVITHVETTLPTNDLNNNNSSSSQKGSRNAGMKREPNIADRGAYAEKLVFEQIKSQYKNVVWVSENAKKGGINPDGIGGLGYDLTYTNDEGKTIYIEIKSTTGTNLSFMISEGELSFAEAHSLQYFIVMVTSVMEEKERKIYYLDALFNYSDGEDRYRNSKFKIVTGNYKILCDIRITQDN